MKRLLAVLLIGALTFLCSCSSVSSQEDGATVPESPAVEQKIPFDALRSISSDLESAAIDEVRVVALDDDGKLKVSVRLDPAITKYSFALDMEPTIEELKDALIEYDVELSEYEMSAVFYKNGEVDNIMFWTSTDLETGHFVSPLDGLSADMSVSAVFEHCEYTAGEYVALRGF